MKLCSLLNAGISQYCTTVILLTLSTVILLTFSTVMLLTPHISFCRAGCNCAIGPPLLANAIQIPLNVGSLLLHCLSLYTQLFFHDAFCRFCLPALPSDSFAMSQETPTGFFTFWPATAELGLNRSLRVMMRIFNNLRMPGLLLLQMLSRRTTVRSLSNISQAMPQCALSPAIVPGRCNKERSRVCWAFRTLARLHARFHALTRHPRWRTTQIG